MSHGFNLIDEEIASFSGGIKTCHLLNHGYKSEEKSIRHA
jgi:hypothetical protein